MHTIRRLITRAGIAALLMTPLFSWAEEPAPSTSTAVVEDKPDPSRKKHAAAHAGAGTFNTQEVGNRRGDRAVTGGQLEVGGVVLDTVPANAPVVGALFKAEGTFKLRYGAVHGGTDSARSNKTAIMDVKAMGALEFKLNPALSLLVGTQLTSDVTRTSIGEGSGERAAEKLPVNPDQDLLGAEPLIGLINKTEKTLTLFTANFVNQWGHHAPELNGHMMGPGIDLLVATPHVDLKLDAGFLYGKSMERDTPGSPGTEAWRVYGTAQATAKYKAFYAGLEYQIQVINDDNLDHTGQIHTGSAVLGVRK